MNQQYISPTVTVVDYAFEGVILYSGVKNMQDTGVFMETLDGE